MILRERLAQLTDDELIELGGSTDEGWGATGTAVLDGSTVFLKRLPLSEVEHAHPYSTKNHFRLPTYYSYGVGSAGFGAWREVVAQQTASGAIGVPELLHHRVLPRTAPPRSLPVSPEQYVAYWNGNAAIGRYMAMRDAATREVWLVSEHGGQRADRWLLEHPASIEDVLCQVFAALDRLHERGITHFDAHLANVVIDGGTCRLIDFGLAMGDGFELSINERRFLDRHRCYDHAVVLLSLAFLLSDVLGDSVQDSEVAATIRALHDLGAPLPPELEAALRRFRGPVLYMLDWWARMRRPTKRSNYDDGEMRSLLDGAGVPT